MTYFIFDMDETLGELYSVYYFISSLRIKDILMEYPEITRDWNFGNAMTDRTTNALKRAYIYFIKGILEMELTDTPLGVLRPGILYVMYQLNELKKVGKIKGVIIYSNNSHLQSLEFIRDIINEYLGTTNLIKDLIHWDHPLRQNETDPTISKNTKTWQVLKNILIYGETKAHVNIKPKSVYFFDDLIHPDLKSALDVNYYKVPVYSYKAPFNAIKDIYVKSINKSNIDISEYYTYIKNVLRPSSNTYTHSKKSELEKIIQILKINASIDNDSENDNNSTESPTVDEGIYIMLDVIRIVHKSGNSIIPIS